MDELDRHDLSRDPCRSRTSSRCARLAMEPGAFDYVAGGVLGRDQPGRERGGVAPAPTAAARARRRESRIDPATTMLGPAGGHAARRSPRWRPTASPTPTPRSAIGPGCGRGRRPVHPLDDVDVLDGGGRGRRRPDGVRWFQLYTQAEPGPHPRARRAGRGRRIRGDRADRRPAGAGLPGARPALRVRAHGAARQLRDAGIERDARAAASIADGFAQLEEQLLTGAHRGTTSRRSEAGRRCRSC